MEILIFCSERVEQLMKDPAEPTEETKHSRGFGSYVFWAGVVLLLYVLSAGPYMKMWEKGVWKNHPRLFRLTDWLYVPFGWAYKNTPLHKPLGIYLHFWCSERFDKKGDYAY
jgi:hypothetical protein